MIKVRKSVNAPLSLGVGCTSHSGQDVQSALLIDSEKKCYLCEQFVDKGFEIEHNRGQTRFPHLKYEWTNLYMSCTYCNGRKSGGYDVLNPSTNNIEDLIEQRLDLANKRIQYVGDQTNAESVSTVDLLSKLFNGNGNLRDVKCKMLYEDLQREYVNFLQFLADYKSDKTEANKQKILDSLLITKEFLAFKYWLIKDDPALDAEFGPFIIWNK